jgi:hypothetical protein
MMSSGRRERVVRIAVQDDGRLLGSHPSFLLVQQDHALGAELDDQIHVERDVHALRGAGGVREASRSRRRSGACRPRCAWTCP